MSLVIHITTTDYSRVIMGLTNIEMQPVIHFHRLHIYLKNIKTWFVLVDI
jgi:hypothetical protein